MKKSATKSTLCFGELLLRLAFEADGLWLNKHAFTVYPAGAEANVACALAKWNIPVSYFTALPDNAIGWDLKNELTERGVDTSSIRMEGTRMGLYYLPTGKDIKKGGVIYDRAESSFAQLQKGVINWNEILQGHDWFHVSAISPALTAHTAELCVEALQAASKMGLTISIDLNFRAALWKYGQQPPAVMPRLVEHADIIMGNIWSAQSLLGIPLDEKKCQMAGRDEFVALSKSTAIEIQNRYSKCKTVAHTFRFDEGQGILYYATLYNQGKQLVSADYQSVRVVDKVGSGDCFMAGLIYGHFHGLDLQMTLDYATAAAFAKLGEHGDTINKTDAEIKSILRTVKS